MTSPFLRYDVLRFDAELRRIAPTGEVGRIAYLPDVL